MNMINKIILFIKNIIKWYPILKKDQDYDYAYIIDSLILKLQKTSLCLEKNDRHEDTKREVEKMNTCISLLKKFRNDFYEDEYQNYYHSNTFEYDKSCEFDNLEEYFSKYSKIYKRLKLERPDLSNVYIAMQIGYIKSEQAKNIAFEIIKNNIGAWWD